MVETNVSLFQVEISLSRLEKGAHGEVLLISTALYAEGARLVGKKLVVVGGRARPSFVDGLRAVFDVFAANSFGRIFIGENSVVLLSSYAVDVVTADALEAGKPGDVSGNSNSTRLVFAILTLSSSLIGDLSRVACLAGCLVIYRYVGGRVSG